MEYCMNPINLGGRAIAFSSLLIATHVAFASDITHLEQKILKLETSVEQIQNRTTEKIRSNDLNVKHKPDFDIQLYGSVRADFSYQTDGGDASRLYNQINTVPLKGSALSSDIFKSTLAASRLGMDIKSESNHVAGKLEFDFLGGINADQFRIRHAYLTYDQWLIGQTWSNFAMPDFMPETIDGLGYVGGSVRRFMQLRHTWSLGSQTALVSALEDSKDAQTYTRLPALTLRLNQKFDHGKELKMDYYHVNGDSSFVAWTNPGIAINPVTNDIVEKNEFNSLALGVTYKYSPKLRGTWGYGYMSFSDNQRYRQNFTNEGRINKNLWQSWVNMMYNPTRPVTFGMEYVYGKRETFQNKQGLDNRLNLVAIYSF
ncbi:hypothetical protein FQR65_LT17895 [Abscondita terminalis]|nr:hypothetical protein FQR65_LT17895 [Abscondita terminalis]